MFTRRGNSFARPAPLPHVCRAAFALVCCAAFAAAGARSLTPRVPPQDAAARGEGAAEGLAVLRVQVVDKKGRYVDDARAEDFRVREDGAEQKIELFSKEEAPASYGVIVDNSGSMRKMLELVGRTGVSIIDANRAGDETFVVRFVGGDKIQTLADFTASREELADAFGEMYAEGGETALFDAVYAAVERVAEHRKGEPNRARAVVLVTDGEDRRSVRKREELIELLRGAGVKVFSIGLIYTLEDERGFIKSSPRDRAGDLLNSFAEASGGRAFYPKTTQDLQQVVAEISRGVRSHYVLGYRPTNAARDGKFRKVKIEMADAPGRADRKALAPAGYFARKPAAEPPEKK